MTFMPCISLTDSSLIVANRADYLLEKTANNETRTSPVKKDRKKEYRACGLRSFKMAPLCSVLQRAKLLCKLASAQQRKLDQSADKTMAGKMPA